MLTTYATIPLIKAPQAYLIIPNWFLGTSNNPNQKVIEIAGNGIRVTTKFSLDILKLRYQNILINVKKRKRYDLCNNNKHYYCSYNSNETRAPYPIIALIIIKTIIINLLIRTTFYGGTSFFNFWNVSIPKIFSKSLSTDNKLLSTFDILAVNTTCP